MPTPGAAQLLVSVGSADEAAAALQGGADIIDIKDPSRGALGRVRLAGTREIVRAIAGRLALTAAWGELPQASPFTSQEALTLAGVGLIKLGTAGCPSPGECRNRWELICRRAPSGTRLAVVHYADWQSAGGLDFANSIELALSGGEGPLVIDTFNKRGGNLFAHYSVVRLKDMLQELHGRGIPSVIAGSLRLDDFEQVLTCHPTVIAVRGAACHGGNRSSPISPQRIAALRDSIRHGHTSPPDC